MMFENGEVCWLCFLLGGVTIWTSTNPLVLGQCSREYEQGSVNMSVHELAAQGKEVAGKEAR